MEEQVERSPLCVDNIWFHLGCSIGMWELAVLAAMETPLVTEAVVFLILFPLDVVDRIFLRFLAGITGLWCHGEHYPSEKHPYCILFLCDLGSGSESSSHSKLISLWWGQDGYFSVCGLMFASFFTTVTPHKADIKSNFFVSFFVTLMANLLPGFWCA